MPVAADSGFGLDNLPYGVDDSSVLVAVGDAVLDLTACARAVRSPYAELFAAPSLDALLAAGPATWAAVRAEITTWLTDASYRSTVEPFLGPRDDARLRLPFTVGDYVDFYASEQHATNLGHILRPGEPALRPNWHHLPVGYHGRSGTVVVSGTPVVRPQGQRGAGDFGPTRRLDVEVEVGFVVGAPSRHGNPVATGDFAAHVFGVCLVNDWSARDIQAWEYQPLGPFLGKSFATSVSPWVVPLAALSAARAPVGSAGRDLAPYLREAEPWGLDLALELRRNGEVLSRPPYREMFWSPAQMLAHMTVNGASVRTGDLFASGTVSGADRSQWGSLIELSGNTEFLADGDEIVIGGSAPSATGGRLSLGEVRGVVTPAAAVPRG
ncbi:MAG: fumarylacetoacetase [Frankiaceae bacterium]|nr:fumarylacetoacetase [Frankiaceae bacterium]